MYMTEMCAWDGVNTIRVIRVYPRAPRAYTFILLPPPSMRILSTMQKQSVSTLMSELKEKVAEQENKITMAKRELELLNAQLSVLSKVDPSAEPKAAALVADERVSLTKAGPDAMEALGQFTKREVAHWIRDKYPSLTFSIKSLDRVFAKAIADKKVEIVKPNIGNKFPAIYGWKK